VGVCKHAIVYAEGQGKHVSYLDPQKPLPIWRAAEIRAAKSL